MHVPSSTRVAQWSWSGALSGFGLLLMIAVAACRTTPPPAPSGAVFRTEKLDAIDAAINEAIVEHRTPGAVFWLERNGTTYQRAYGNRALQPAVEPMTPDTIFDVASLTKVLATAPSIMLLIERGQVKLDAPVKEYIEEFRREGRDTITIRHLLTHTSGLRPGLSIRPEGYYSAIQIACQEKTNSVPGTAFRYSDINYILLGEVVHRVAGMSLAQFADVEIYQPLKMRDTGFGPTEKLRPRIAPTERSEKGMLRGIVHDPTARRMEGVAGHAGLFSTAADMARFARMILNRGTLDGVRVLKSETVDLMTRVQSESAVLARRGLGWDIDSPYSRPRGIHFPLGSFGHTGWTGTVLWIDPYSQTFWVFLSNRVHPDGSGNVLALYSELGTLAAEAVADYDFAHVNGALPARTNWFGRAVPGLSNVTTAPVMKVLNGIDVLAQQNFAPLKKLRVGLITNHTGHDRERNATIDLLKHAPEVELKCLFSPEHGLRGEKDEKVGDSVDEATQLPVYSLYGERRAPTSAQLEGLDALVFDIQDIGCRFYTYSATLGLCLEAAAQNKLKFFVLDRVNPINGLAVEGPVYRGKSTFTAYHALPLRHGLTLGELARLYKAELGWNADLTVIPAQGWSRGMWFDETGLPWTNPSPNMRRLNAAILYPGVGLLETAVSVGRGTDTPFEVVGAPYVKDVEFADTLNAAKLPGIRFVPHQFTPDASVFKGKPCGGVSMVITDRNQLRSVDVGLLLALTLQRLYPGDFAIGDFNRLLQHPATIEQIKQGESIERIKAGWQEEQAAFTQRRAAYLLYH